MKMFSLLPAACAATLFLAAGLHAADATSTAPASADSASTPAAPGPRHEKMLKRFDKNGDGKLDDAERAEAKEQMRAENSARRGKMRDRLVKRFDKDHDGKLTGAELDAAVASIEKRPRVIERFDRDGDGKLSPEEKAAADLALRKQFSGE
jgi:EF hand